MDIPRQVVVCLTGAQQLPEPILTYWQLYFNEQIVMKLYSKFKCIIQENALENVVCKMTAILFLFHYVNWRNLGATFNEPEQENMKPIVTLHLSISGTNEAIPYVFPTRFGKKHGAGWGEYWKWFSLRVICSHTPTLQAPRDLARSRRPSWNMSPGQRKCFKTYSIIKENW